MSAPATARTDAAAGRPAGPSRPGPGPGCRPWRPTRSAGEAVEPVARHARATSSASARPSSACSSSTILVLTAIFAADHRDPRPERRRCSRPTSRARVKRSPPCIHLLGCPADKPRAPPRARRQLPRRVQPGRLRRPDLARRSASPSIGFAILIGSLIGAIAGYVGGLGGQRPDAAHGRHPGLPLAAPRDRHRDRRSDASLFNALLAIGIVAIPVYARVARASVLSVQGERLRDGVAGARRIDARHPPPADPAELADAARRPGHARHRRRGPRDRGPAFVGVAGAHRRAGVGLDDRPRVAASCSTRRT